MPATPRTRASAADDRVQASVTHELSDNIEDLTLTGTADIDGTGNDLDNVFLGNVGDNVLSGLGGEDFMNGSSGADTLLGGGGIDTLQGSFGRDTLDGGTGADIMDGSFGDDTYIVDNLGDVAADSGNGTDHVLSSVTHFLDADIENLTLTGAAASNGTGNGGDNVIIGNGAINVLSGLGGRDTLDGGAGADDMFGGGGNDTYIVDDAGDTTTEFNGGGTDLVNASVTTTLDTNVENLTLTGTADIDGTGNGSDNDIVGNGGDNLLSGGGGADTLIGGDGRDTLEGDGGNDVFVFNAVGELGPLRRAGGLYHRVRRCRGCGRRRDRPLGDRRHRRGGRQCVQLPRRDPDPVPAGYRSRRSLAAQRGRQHDGLRHH